MRHIVFLMYFDFSWSVYDNLASLHEESTETLIRSVTKYDEIVITFEKSKNRSIAKNFLKVLKDSFCFDPHT